MRGWRSAKVSTIREEFDEINDSMKVSSSRMKNKVGAQKGAFIKMKQENSYIYQRIYVVCYVPIIAPFLYFFGLIFTLSCTRTSPSDVISTMSSIIISLYSNISSVLPLSFLQKKEQRQPLPSGIRILGTPKHVFRVTPGGSTADRVLRCRRRG